MGCADESEISSMPRRRREHQKSKIFKRFKDTLDELSAYLLWKNPPKCVFEMENRLNRVFENIGSEGLDKMNIGLMRSMEMLGKVLS